jgi:hypothetical protein
VNVNCTQTGAGSELARQAEALLRSLAGVSHAHVQAGPRGIDTILVIADDPVLAPALAGHVRSALLAGLSTPILPARIHVRVADSAREPDTSGSGVDHTAAVGAHEQGTRHVPRIEDHDLPPATHGTQPDPPPAITAQAGRQIATEAPRLVAVDREQPAGGQIRCRVTIALRTGVYTAEAVAVDLPGAPAHAAAQAAVRAMVEAGIHGLELEGLREIEIAGRDYTVVALRRTDSCVRVRSGSALVAGSPERAAAIATVAASRDLI